MNKYEAGQVLSRAELGGEPEDMAIRRKTVGGREAEGEENVTKMFCFSS